MRKLQLRLGAVERNLLNFGNRCGEVGRRLRWRMIAPGAYWIEIGDLLRGKMRCEGFAAEFHRELRGEVLEHGQRDEEGVSWLPWSGCVVQQVEFDGKVTGVGIAGLRDEGVDAACVRFELMELVGGEHHHRTIGGFCKLQGALQTVMRDEIWAEDFGLLA